MKQRNLTIIHAEKQNKAFHKMKDALLIHEIDKGSNAINRLRRTAFEWIKSHETLFSPSPGNNNLVDRLYDFENTREIFVWCKDCEKIKQIVQIKQEDNKIVIEVSTSSNESW